MAHTLNQLSEDTLDCEAVDQTRNGDSDAFGELVNRYTARIFALCLRYTDDRLDSEEAVQDIFLKAYRGLASFDISRRFFPWLYAIALNHLRSLGRRNATRHHLRSIPLSEELLGSGRPGEDSEPEAALLSGETSELLDRALHRLRADHRRVFLLRQIEGLSTTNTAELLGIAENTVKTHLRRARLALQKALSDW